MCVSRSGTLCPSSLSLSLSSSSHSLNPHHPSAVSSQLIPTLEIEFSLSLPLYTCILCIHVNVHVNSNTSMKFHLTNITSTLYTYITDTRLIYISSHVKCALLWSICVYVCVSFNACFSICVSFCVYKNNVYIH